MHTCVGCGTLIDNDSDMCDRCCDYSYSEFLVLANPEIEDYVEEPCNHNFREIGDGVAQCSYCGQIEG